MGQIAAIERHLRGHKLGRPVRHRDGSAIERERRQCRRAAGKEQVAGNYHDIVADGGWRGIPVSTIGNPITVTRPSLGYCLNRCSRQQHRRQYHQMTMTHSTIIWYMLATCIQTLSSTLSCYFRKGASPCLSP